MGCSTPEPAGTSRAGPCLALLSACALAGCAACLSYRGYFSESAAETYAKALEARGWDVTVAGVRAYSTLGWFADPLLSSMVELPEYLLARIVFHELAHRRRDRQHRRGARRRHRPLHRSEPQGGGVRWPERREGKVVRFAATPVESRGVRWPEQREGEQGAADAMDAIPEPTLHPLHTQPPCRPTARSREWNPGSAGVPPAVGRRPATWQSGHPVRVGHSRDPGAVIPAQAGIQVS